MTDDIPYPFLNRLTDVFFQIIDTSGAIVAQPSTQQTQIPVTRVDLAVAARTNGTTMHDASGNGLHLRVITSPGETGQAVQVARSLAEVDASLSSLQRILFGLSGGGIVLTAALGLIVAQQPTWTRFRGMRATPTARPATAIVAAVAVVTIAPTGSREPPA